MVKLVVIGKWQPENRYRGVRADLDAALLHPGRDRARRPATPRDNPQVDEPLSPKPRTLNPKA